MVDRPEEPQRPVPGRVPVEDRLGGARVDGQPPGEPAVDRRAERRELFRLTAEDVGEVAQAALASSAASAAFARSATVANAAGSLTARSASDLRSSSIPALPSPCISWL